MAQPQVLREYPFPFHVPIRVRPRNRDFGRLIQDDEDPLRLSRGNFTSYLGGRVVLGPNRINLLISLIGFASIGVLLIFQEPVISRYFGWNMNLNGFYILLIIIVSLLNLGTSDPGVMQKFTRMRADWDVNPIYRRDVLAGHIRLRDCPPCSSVRPPRTYHCEICGVCIRHQDTHLHMAGTCVGDKNFSAYLILNLFQSLMAFYLITLNGYIFWKIFMKEDEFTVYDVLRTVLSFLIGCFLSIAPQTGVLMLLYRFYLITRGRTMREEYRILKRVDNPRPQSWKDIGRNCLNLINHNPTARSCFRRRLNQIRPAVSSEETMGEVNMDSFHSMHVRRQSRHQPLADQRSFFGSSRTLDLDINLNRLWDSAKAKRNVRCQSEPVLRGGQLPYLPGDRVRIDLKEKPSRSLRRKIKRFQEILQMPKPFVDFHTRPPCHSSYSEGGLPQTTMTSSAVNEILQLARATQIRRMIDYILARDRRNIVRLAQRVDMGGIMGVQFQGMDPQNLQIIELGRQERLEQNQILPPNLRLDNNILLPAGVDQMVAAGFLGGTQGRMARHLTPAHLNSLRSQYLPGGRRPPSPVEPQIPSTSAAGISRHARRIIRARERRMRANSLQSSRVSDTENNNNVAGNNSTARNNINNSTTSNAIVVAFVNNQQRLNRESSDHPETENNNNSN